MNYVVVLCGARLYLMNTLTKNECLRILPHIILGDIYINKEKNVKYCKKCNQFKDETEFGTNNSAKNGLSSYCKSCTYIRIKEWKKNNLDKVKQQRQRYKEKNMKKRKNYRDDNKDVIKNYALKSNYGIDLKEYMDMYLKQNGLCAICHQPQKNNDFLLSVDHNHLNNKIRGLLCRNCNIGLGYFKDNIELLNSAIVYLNDQNG